MQLIGHHLYELNLFLAHHLREQHGILRHSTQAGLPRYDGESAFINVWEGMERKQEVSIRKCAMQVYGNVSMRKCAYIRECQYKEVCKFTEMLV
jgi:hypothetical protein